MFWAIAAIALFTGAFITFLPMLRGKTLWQPAALALMFAVPAAALWLYTTVGTPAAIDLRPTPHPVAANDQQLGDIDAMIDGLRDRLTESPEDFEGWMLLARTLKSVQRFPEALEALQVAQRIRPNDPLVMVELAEARIFVSADGRIDEGLVADGNRVRPGRRFRLCDQLLGVAAGTTGARQPGGPVRAAADQRSPGSPRHGAHERAGRGRPGCPGRGPERTGGADRAAGGKRRSVAGHGR
jgi:cytochrome c-type biogenesis protein CcmH